MTTMKTHEQGPLILDIIKETGLTKTGLCAVLNWSHGTLYNVSRGYRKIKAEEAVIIEKLTEGKYSRVDLRPDLYEGMSS